MGIYNVINHGSFGPAHPMHDPRVTVYVDGPRAHSAENGREGHLWAIRNGHECENQDLVKRESYQALLAQVRYENAGL